MQGQITIKRATQKEAPALFDLRYRAYLMRYALYSDPKDKSLETLEDFTGQLEKDIHFGLYVGKDLVGGAALVRHENLVEIKEVYVAPEFQGRGIGTAALHLLESQVPSAIYSMKLAGNEQKGLFYKSGYRPKEEGEEVGPRFTEYEWIKEAYKQVEILLMPLKRESLPRISSWLDTLSDEEMYSFSGGELSVKPGIELLNDFFSARRHRIGSSQMDFTIEAPEYDAVIGTVSLIGIEWDVRRCQVSRLFIDPLWRNVGLGRQAVEGICQMAANEYTIRGITAGMLESNLAARACFLSAGFSDAFRREEAYIRENGEKLSRIVMMRGNMQPQEAAAEPQSEE